MIGGKETAICAWSVIAGVVIGTASGAELTDACREYLVSNATPAEVAKMEKKLREQVETKAADSGMDEDIAMRHIMLDWATSNSKKLERRDPVAVKQACFYLTRWVGELPWQVRERLSDAQLQELVAWLKKAKHDNDEKRAEKSVVCPREMGAW